MLPFVDISEDQGIYNMAGNTDQLIAIRMSTGALMRFDEQAQRNYNNATAAGKRVLQYHYAGNNDPTEEANLFLKACSPFAEHDLYCLDPELAESKDWCNTFDSVIFAATGCHVIDYGNITWANNVGASPDCALWLAAPSWGFNQTITELHSGIEYIMQQGPTVNGVDSDMCFISLDVLDKYAYHVPNASAPVSQSTPVVTPPVTEPVVTPPTPAAPIVPTPIETPEPTPTPAPEVPATPVETPTVLPTLVNNVPTPAVPPVVTPPTSTPQKPSDNAPKTEGTGIFKCIINWIKEHL